MGELKIENERLILDNAARLQFNPRYVRIGRVQNPGAKVPETGDNFSYVSFFADASQDVLDSYLVALIALDNICEGNMVIK